LATDKMYIVFWSRYNTFLFLLFPFQRTCIILGSADGFNCAVKTEVRECVHLTNHLGLFIGALS